MAPGKIRVLIVDDIAETRDNIRKLLQFEADVEVVGMAKTGKEAIESTNALKPDVILMDINMPDMDGITATEKIRQSQAWAQIVILSVQGDPNYMRRAMLAGARDFLTKPPNIDELISAIRRAGKMAAEEREKATSVVAAKPGSGPIQMSAQAGSVNGVIVSVYSPKGGNGCTTLLTNLAVHLKQEGKNVLVVDGNLHFGNVSIFFNQQAKNHIGDLTIRADKLEREVVENVVVTHDSGVKILPAPPRPELAEEISGDQFLKVLEFCRNIYDYVLVDTVPALTDSTIAALDASDVILAVTTQDIPSIAAMRSFFEVANVMGINSANILFLMNKYDKRITITPERVSANLKKEFTVILPFDERIVVPSVNRGVPFMIDPKNRSQPVAKGITSVAEAVHKFLMEPESVESLRLGRK